MSTITKRSWTKADGSRSTAFVLGYQDASGEWVRRQFSTRAAAQAERVRIDHELARGAHVPDRQSITLERAIEAWLDDYRGLVEAGKRERSTLESYSALAAHVRAHGSVGGMTLARMTPPDVARFGDWLEAHRTPSQAKRTLDLVRSVLRHAVRVGWCSGNAASEVHTRDAGTRHREAVEIPQHDELRRLLAVAEATGPMEHALVSLLTFCGLRASEARGLRREDVHADHIEVAQRADKYGAIGSPKSRTSRRTVPLPASTRRALATWMLQHPGELVFGTRKGTPQSYANIWNRVWVPMMLEAELADDEGKPRWGLHALRHVAVSLWIAQGVQPKQVSVWAGHSSVAFTLDVYGHLWASPETDAQVAAAVERSLLG